MILRKFKLVLAFAFLKVLPILCLSYSSGFGQDLNQPFLISPADGDTVRVGNPSFLWNFGSATIVGLHLELVKLEAGQVGLDAFEQKPPLYTIPVSPDGVWDYPAVFQPLDAGKYAWRLKWMPNNAANDQTANQVSYSDLNIFVIKAEETDPCYVKLQKSRTRILGRSRIQRFILRTVPFPLRPMCASTCPTAPR